MKTIQKAVFSVLLLVFGISLLAVALPTGVAFAAEAPGIESNSSDLSAAMLDPRDRPDDTVDSDFRDAVRGFLNYFLGFLGLIAVIMLVYAGVLMVTSGGDEEQVGKAKTILVWAVVGIILILLSYTIVRMVVTVPVQ